MGIQASVCKGSYSLRAQIRWFRGRREAALADLRQAMHLAEKVHARASGGEFRRATAFSEHVHVFENMVGCQTQLGGCADGLDAMERGRARGLSDQMATAGMDLLAGVPEGHAQKLRQREAEAQGTIAALRKQIEFLAARQDVSTEERKSQQERLVAELHQARKNYAEAYADIRNASPAYRLALGQDRQPVSLDKLGQWATKEKALVLEYLVGGEGGYVLIVPGGGQARLEELTIDQEEALSLGIEPGPLTAERLQAVLRNAEGTGLLQTIVRPDPKQAEQLVSTLASLWRLLIPEAEREGIVEGKYQRLVVLPDATLACLPFETLVVDMDKGPQYLLDAGPPIIYAPSATILLNLAEREKVKSSGGRAPVLTVGDCQYGRPAARSSETLLADLRPSRRYTSAGGKLDRLRYTKWETAWVSQVFGKHDIGSAGLKAELATERNVRSNLPGRRIVHFACHGLVDQAYGNLFGALALTPGPRADDPANDGFLTLAEIYEQNLKGCELAILSACDTNVGPQQRGEGVWAISRGFLVAGSRRVVASNWLVDDQAAASLISYFCSILAKAEKEGKTPDYAEALHDAKRWVRQNTKHEEWKNPYYWGTFVLIGPN